MLYPSWNELLERFQTIYLRSRFSDHAQAIIDLIPLLRDSLLFNHVRPFTSHTTLCLTIPNSQLEICVWGEGDGKYKIYVYDPTKDIVLDEDQVRIDQIVSTLEAYLNKIAW